MDIDNREFEKGRNKKFGKSGKRNVEDG